MGLSKMKHVLWTGGWDSTFRVLYLLLSKNETVQPHYIIDPERKSLEMELRALREIRRVTLLQYPDAASRFLPPLITHKSAIPPDSEITRHYQEYARLNHAGSQYEWLCRYARHCAPGGLELCVERGSDPSDNRIHDSICQSRDVEKIQCGGDSYYTIGNRFSQPELSIFQGIHFPLLDYTKREAAAIASELGFAELLEMTWFCHHPGKDGKPCGICRPCLQTKMEGLGRRVPNPTLPARLRHYLREVYALARKHM